MSEFWVPQSSYFTAKDNRILKTRYKGVVILIWRSENPIFMENIWNQLEITNNSRFKITRVQVKDTLIIIRFKKEKLRMLPLKCSYDFNKTKTRNKTEVVIRDLVTTLKKQPEPSRTSERPGRNQSERNKNKMNTNIF